MDPKHLAAIQKALDYNTVTLVDMHSLSSENI